MLSVISLAGTSRSFPVRIVPMRNYVRVVTLSKLTYTVLWISFMGEVRVRTHNLTLPRIVNCTRSYE